MDGGGVGGWYPWQKEPRAAYWFFLFQIKKGTSKLTKMAVLRKKGTLGNQWQCLISSRFDVIEFGRRTDDQIFELSDSSKVR